MRQSREYKTIGLFFLGWGGMEGVIRKAFIEKGVLELSLEGRAAVYHGEMGERIFQAEELPKQNYIKSVKAHGFWGEQWKKWWKPGSQA